MFLHELSGTEKKAFLELAHKVANANGVTHESEQKLINTYDREMGIDLQIEDLNDKSLEELTGLFESDRTKRIVFLEALAISFADGVYHDEEKELVQKLKTAFNISDEEYEAFKAWISKTNALYAQADELIGS